ncbi:MAG: hypothetical protein GXO47_05930, partial [Chlorobi bacterium]|nr:hypothetical protein [Chlorobiota bacterium]
VDDMNGRNADFIIQLGDFCYPDSTSDSFMKVFRSFKGDKYSVLGNHDKDNGANLKQALKYFGMPAPYYSFDKNNFHFIVLNGNEAAQKTSGYARSVSNKQISWLNKDLDKTDKRTVVFIHQSLFDKHGVINQDTIRKILSSKHLKNGEKKVLVCFNGHSHIDAAEKTDGVWYVSVNSMSYHWVGEEFRHKSYSDKIQKEHPWIEYVCPYKDPVYAFVTIDKDGTITIKGKHSEWKGASPEKLGYTSKYYKNEWIIPGISDRVLKP